MWSDSGTCMHQTEKHAREHYAGYGRKAIQCKIELFLRLVQTPTDQMVSGQCLESWINIQTLQFVCQLPLLFFCLCSHFETCSPGSSSFCLFAAHSSCSSRSLFSKASFTSSRSLALSLCFAAASLWCSFFVCQEQCRNPVDIIFIPALSCASWNKMLFSHTIGF